MSLEEQLASQCAWPIDRIKDHALKIGSGSTPSGGATTYLDSGIPLLRSQNVHFDGLRLDDVAFISEATHEEMSGTKLRPGDVLLNITGASIGRCTYVPPNLVEGNVNQHVCIIRPSAGLSHRFLAYCLGAPWGQDQILSSFTGASRQGLGQRDLGAIQIPLPPHTEQERIADHLDQTSTSIRGAIAAKATQLEELERVRENIIENAVTAGLTASVPKKAVHQDWLGEVPAHWDVVRVKRVVRQMDYGISESTEQDGRFPVLKMGNIQRGEIVHSDIEYVENVDEDLILEFGDLLYNRTNSADQVAKAAIYRGTKREGVTFASYLVRLRVNGRADPFYLNYVLNSRGFLSFARRLAIPSVQQSNLNSTRYGRMLLPLPPKSEQAEIRAVLDKKLGDLQRVVAVINSQIDVLLGYQRALAHEYVTGQRQLEVVCDSRRRQHG